MYSRLDTWFDIDVRGRNIPDIKLTFFDKFDLLRNNVVVGVLTFEATQTLLGFVTAIAKKV